MKRRIAIVLHVPPIAGAMVSFSLGPDQVPRWWILIAVFWMVMSAAWSELLLSVWRAVSTMEKQLNEDRLLLHELEQDMRDLQPEKK